MAEFLPGQLPNTRQQTAEQKRQDYPLVADPRLLAEGMTGRDQQGNLWVGLGNGRAKKVSAGSAQQATTIIKEVKSTGGTGDTQAMNDHIASRSNPHATTAAHVGADPAGTAQALLAANAGSIFELDADGDLMPRVEMDDPGLFAVLFLDGGDICPIGQQRYDRYFNLDADNDIQPKAV